MTSSRPYLIRAMYEWLTDNDLTPHVVVNTEMPNVMVPKKFIVDGRIILNISASATQKLLINNEALEFDARFDSGVRHVYVPVDTIMAIYARENGRGMVFDEEGEGGGDDGGGDNINIMDAAESPAQPSKPGKPQLKIVK